MLQEDATKLILNKESWPEYLTLLSQEAIRIGNMCKAIKAGEELSTQITISYCQKRILRDETLCWKKMKWKWSIRTYYGLTRKQ